ncbi:MAG: hypothetical protein V3U75_13540 [Methylococcaceae bacterium]
MGCTRPIVRGRPPIVIVDIDVTDSPYTVVRRRGVEQTIVVDDSGGNVTVVLYPKVKADLLTLKKKGDETYKVTYQGNGSNIDGQPERELLTQNDSVNLRGESNEWGRY